MLTALFLVKISIQAIIEESWLKQPVWYKLYKTALVRDIPFPVGKYHEDVFWSYQAVGKAQKVSVTDKVGYYYVQRSDSIMGEGYSIKRLDAVWAKSQRLEFVRQHYTALVPVCETELFFTCLYHGQMAIKYLDHMQAKHVFDILKEKIPDLPFFSSHLPIKKRCWTVLSKVSLIETCRIRCMLGIGF